MTPIVGQFARGCCMGAADIVPGVSGGTVALVLGIYERLVANVRLGAGVLGRLARGDGRGARAAFGAIEWTFILPLLAGIGAAVLVLASLIERLLDEQPVRLGALFFGLVAGSVVIAARLLRRPAAVHFVMAIAVGTAVALLFGLRSATEGTEGGSASLWVFPLAGALAICAMILPGVSGSFLLVLIGMYGPVLAAVNERDLPPIALFGVGAVLGLAVFSSLLDRLLRTRHDQVLAVMIGLLLGSLRVLWPWPGGTSSTTLAAPAGDVLVPVLLAGAGFALVVALGILGHVRSEPAPLPRDEPIHGT